jgi:hypothetical protein
MEPVIKERIIRGGKRVGMLAAYKFPESTCIEDRVKIGFCLCSKADKYDKELEKKICYARATTKKEFYVVPDSINTQFEEFRDRCIRYFKDCVFEQE